MESNRFPFNPPLPHEVLRVALQLKILKNTKNII